MVELGDFPLGLADRNIRRSRTSFAGLLISHEAIVRPAKAFREVGVLKVGPSGHRDIPMVELTGRADFDQPIFDPHEQALKFRDRGRQRLDIFAIRQFAPSVGKAGVDLNYDVNLGADRLRRDHHARLCGIPPLWIERSIEPAREPSTYEASTCVRTLGIDAAAALAGPAMPAPCPARPILHAFDR